MTSDSVSVQYMSHSRELGIVLMGSQVRSEVYGERVAWAPGCTSSCCRMLLRAGAESRGTVCIFFLPLFCLRDTIASFNILYLASAKRGK